jgi:hypothetical protein
MHLLLFDLQDYLAVVCLSISSLQLYYTMGVR